MSKFIHHERITSDWMSEEEGFDVIEDSEGFKVYEGSMIVAEAGTLHGAIRRAKRLLATADARHKEEVQRRLYRHRLSGLVGNLVTGKVRDRDGRVFFAAKQGDRLWVDPEYLEEVHPIIDARAERARRAMAGGDYQSMDDLITDLLHLADVEGQDFDLVVEDARNQFENETGKGDDIEQDARRYFAETGKLG